MLAFPAVPAAAALDLSRAEVTHLHNGLTVILLEDHSRPLVSVQVSYKSGSIDETAGKTGLAHFLEHLAFRASTHFPNAAATEAIYDAGGEWHGYTWLDSTNYFATMPAAQLPLLLRIEADRMARVVIDPAAIEAEKGAVLTEMHGYENDPASVLFDAVAAAAFEAHPYRNNSIGYEADVRALTADDARRFYDGHYAPGNAVLAIAGDFDRAETLGAAARAFANVPARAVAERVNRVEPPHSGAGRISIQRPAARQYFEFAFPAPAASSADFAAFLVLQQYLSGGSGVNFRDNDWGTPVRGGSALDGLAGDVKSWFIPTGERYLITVTGTTDPRAGQPALERGLRAGLDHVQVTAAALAEAKGAVAEALAEDVQSTEDAAHQLAYFEAIGALDPLLDLPRAVERVTAADVRRVLRAYLGPDQATIGWLVPGPTPSPAALGSGSPAPASERPGLAASAAVMPAPVIRQLRSGIPAIVQFNPLSPTVTIAVITDTGASPLLPENGIIRASGAAADLERIAADVRRLLNEPAARSDPPSEDPETRLQQMIARQLPAPRSGRPKPIAVLLSGAVSPVAGLAAIERVVGSRAPGHQPTITVVARSSPPHTVRERIAKPLPQAALGYVVAAPPPASRSGLAWRMLLYILTHDYSGRLGRSAIAEQGLVYHIYSDYRTDGQSGWITLSSGVDPDKQDAFEQALRREIANLERNPPTAAEVDAARHHLIGRDISGAQTNDEIVDKLAYQFVSTGKLVSAADYAASVKEVTAADVLAAADEFGGGTILRVDVGPAPR